jgi:hypothetical protein
VRNAYPLRLMVFAYLALAVVTALWLAGRGGLGGRVGVASSDGLATMDGLAGGDGLAGDAGPVGQGVTARPGWHTWGRWLLAALVIVGIALDTPPMPADGHTTIPTFISSGEYQRQLSRGEIVVVVSKIGNAGMLWQAESGFYWRLAGGYVNQAITRRSDLPKQVQDLAHATPASVLAFEAYIRTNHIGAILLSANSEPQWVGIFWRMGLKGHRIDNVEVYPTNGCRSCRVLSPSDLY